MIEERNSQAGCLEAEEKEGEKTDVRFLIQLDSIVNNRISDVNKHSNVEETTFLMEPVLDRTT